MGPTRQIDELEAARETARVLFEAEEPATRELDRARQWARSIYHAAVLHGVCKHELYAQIYDAEGAWA